MNTPRPSAPCVLELQCQVLCETLMYIARELKLASLNGERPVWADELEPMLRDPRLLFEVAGGEYRELSVTGWPREGFPAFALTMAPTPTLSALVLRLKGEEDAAVHRSTYSRLSALRSTHCADSLSDPPSLAGSVAVLREGPAT